MRFQFCNIVFVFNQICAAFALVLLPPVAANLSLLLLAVNLTAWRANISVVPLFIALAWLGSSLLAHADWYILGFVLYRLGITDAFYWVLERLSRPLILLMFDRDGDGTVTTAEVVVTCREKLNNMLPVFGLLRDEFVRRSYASARTGAVQLSQTVYASLAQLHAIPDNTLLDSEQAIITSDLHASATLLDVLLKRSNARAVIPTLKCVASTSRLAIGGESAANEDHESDKTK